MEYSGSQHLKNKSLKMTYSYYKKLLSGIILFLGLCNYSSAQTEIWSAEAAKYVGKIVKFDESVFSVDYNPRSKTCSINMADPDVANSPTIVVVVHDVRTTKRVNWFKALEIQTITVTGRLLRDKNRFVIDGNDPHTRVEPEKVEYINHPVPFLPPTAGPNTPDPDQQSPDTTHKKQK